MLYVYTNGSKYWLLKYRIEGKEKVLALEIYPHVTLSEARERRDEAKKILANGKDPGSVKTNTKARKLLASNTFEALAREWYHKQSSKWVEKNTARTLSLLSRNILPFIGSIPIAQVTPANLLDALHRVEKQGKHETAHRALQVCGQIFRYGIATGRAQADLSLVLKGALTPVRKKHHARITDPKAVGDLLRTIHGYEGSFLT